MNAESGEAQSAEFGTQAIQPVAFRYATGWLSWQAVVGDLARTAADARLRIEATGRGGGAGRWAAGLEWGEHHERLDGQPALADALLGLWREVAARHQIYVGDLSKRGPAMYKPDEFLDEESQAGIERLFGVVRAAFGVDWAVSLTYQPVLQAEHRITGRLVADDNQIDVSASGATLIEATRGLLRAAAPHLPKQKK